MRYFEKIISTFWADFTICLHPYVVPFAVHFLAYIHDLNAFFEEVRDGVYVHQTLDGIFQDRDGKQLATEAMYLYGVMLLLLDKCIPGIAREQIIVSYHRYKGPEISDSLENVIKLCRRTGYVYGNKKENAKLKDYPESFFARFGVAKDIPKKIIGCLIDEDIFKRVTHFTAEFRSAAFANQASMIYVVLYFCPDILTNQFTTMRRIVDQHFSDNWVISYFYGFIVDLTRSWSKYKAATTALQTTVDIRGTMSLAKEMSLRVPVVFKKTKFYLTKGILNEEYVMTHIDDLFKDIRYFNATLRWIVLHRQAAEPKFKKHVQDLISEKDCLKLTLEVAQFEFLLKEEYASLLANKETSWNECKTECTTRMQELSEYFSGTKKLARVIKDAKLEEWFRNLGQKIGELDYRTSTATGRVISHLIKILTSVEDYYTVSSSLEIRQFLEDTRGYLSKMLRICKVNHDDLSTLGIVTDFSYAWQIIHGYTPLMHVMVKQDPYSVLLLRATFLKLISIMDLPLVRMSQCSEQDVESVANYYSTELMKFIQRVLDVIPKTMFEVLSKVVQLKTNLKLGEIPMKIERKHLKEYAHLKERYQLAKYTRQISVLTEGILSMKTTLVGSLALDPKQLLETGFFFAGRTFCGLISPEYFCQNPKLTSCIGIRKELIRQITISLHSTLQFPNYSEKDEQKSNDSFEQKVQEIGEKLDNFKKSFEYIQDYVSIYGLQIWQEVFTRVISYHVEQESNRFLKKKILDHQSQYQDDEVPIPRLSKLHINNPDPHDESITFMGRIVYQLLKQTEPRRAIYVDAVQGWYDLQSFHLALKKPNLQVKSAEKVGLRTFDILKKGVGIGGLAGIDRLISFMIVHDLRWFKSLYAGNLLGDKTVLRDKGDQKSRDSEIKLLRKIEDFLRIGSPPGGTRNYPPWIQKFSFILKRLSSHINRIGQKQLIRQRIVSELQFSAKMDSGMLYESVLNLNNALFEDIKAHYRAPEEKKYPDEENTSILTEFQKYLATCGLEKPLEKVYITSPHLEGISIVMFLYLLYQIPNLEWSSNLVTIMRKRSMKVSFKDTKGFIDGGPMTVGILTVLKQFHRKATLDFLRYIGQYIRIAVSETYATSYVGDGSEADRFSKNELKELKKKKVGKDPSPMFSETVYLLLRFVELFCRFGGYSISIFEDYVPPFIYQHFSMF